MSSASRVALISCSGSFRWIACALVAIWLLGLTDKTHASCGDYLHHGIMHHGISRQSIGFQSDRDQTVPIGAVYLVESRVERDSSLPFDQSSPATPRCSGPSCQQTPVLPVEKPSPVGHRIINDLCDCVRLADVTSCGWSFLERTSDDCSSDGVSRRLDRPPRLARPWCRFGCLLFREAPVWCGYIEFACLFKVTSFPVSRVTASIFLE